MGIIESLIQLAREIDCICDFKNEKLIWQEKSYISKSHFVRKKTKVMKFFLFPGLEDFFKNSMVEQKTLQ